MGLDLTALSRQVRQMSGAAALRVADTAERTAHAVSRYRESAGEERHWARAADLSRESASWLLAHPVEPLGTARGLPERPESYALVASDGSQIDLDRHGSVACYLINIGRVFLRYGEDPLARLSSEPALYYRDEDLYLTDGARRVAIEGNYLSARRDVDEGVALVGLADEFLSDGLPCMALQDGTLIRWALSGAERFVQEHFLERYLAYLDAMRERGVPVASYISRPRSPEVVGTIRLMLCPDVDVAAGRGAKCDECSDVADGREPSCAVCQGLVDTDVLAGQLTEGQRGPLFISMSRINVEDYREHTIHFFHMRVGRELARVEIPQWVAQDPEQVDLIHALVYDQAARGDGYPVALARAHEQAVVRSADRRTFQSILEGSLYRAEAGASASAKKDSKSFIRG
ncbi:DNA double-strand break repair nuclease NurA [Oscillochloris sp. ZM17-4]|uniref:DNA double-strand break repair nuclease NurA n=1 Tax=Oscillochloris sp. ZM17-4 TaxID=2866714 RepID=UPI001C7304F3|nr:DNA double-strand break repair nuclease NurA [Oscillochloris sp. ZM17-4]MBX0327553.1 DNA double-strand break repair nuclease NurA [Oscillochloris sp. ZM17-4]